MKDIATLRQLAVAAPGNASSLSQLLNHLIDAQADQEERLQRCESRVQIALEAVGAAGEMLDTLSAEVATLTPKGVDTIVHPDGSFTGARPLMLGVDLARMGEAETDGIDRMTNEGGPPPSVPAAPAQEKTE